MVQIDVVRSCVSTLVKTHPLVAVFVGGTSGIGEVTIQALASIHGNQGAGLRIYIVGRKAEAAEKTIADCRRVCPKGQFRFIQAKDLALLKDVDSVCAEITRLEEEENANGRGPARVDLLVTSQAYLTLEPRRETAEGLDTLMSLLYYSRMRFTVQLLPLLLASPLPTGAHVISVYAAGKEDKLFPQDLSLRDAGHYSFTNCRSHVTYMTTLFMEQLAERYPGKLSLVHLFPGLVVTDAFASGLVRMPLWVKVAWRLLAPFAKLFSVPPRECGERVVFLATERYPARESTKAGKGGGGTAASTTKGDVGIAVGTDGKRGTGAYAINWNGETIPTEKTYKKIREEGTLAGKVWDHTMKAFEEIEAGKVFAG